MLLTRWYGAFSPLSLFAGGVTGGWYDPSDINTLWKDTAGTDPVTADGDAVARIDDKSGNGKHLTQATAARRPLYKSDASGKYLLFDGTDDNLNNASAVVNSLPFDRLSAIRQVAYAVSSRIFQTGTTYLNSRVSTPSLNIFDGTSDVVTNSDLAIGVNGVVTERHVSGASQLAVNNGGYTTGNAGSTAPGNPLVIAASSDAGGAAKNMRCYGMIIRTGAMSTTQIAQSRTWLGAKIGLVL